MCQNISVTQHSHCLCHSASVAQHIQEAAVGSGKLFAGDDSCKMPSESFRDLQMALHNLTFIQCELVYNRTCYQIVCRLNCHSDGISMWKINLSTLVWLHQMSRRSAVIHFINDQNNNVLVVDARHKFRQSNEAAGISRKLPERNLQYILPSAERRWTRRCDCIDGCRVRFCFDLNCTHCVRFHGT